MKAFTYARADSAAHAATISSVIGTKIIAGGTNLLDLMKLQIETPSTLVDINRLPLDNIDETSDGGLRIGALVRNCDLAADSRVRQRYGVLSRALLAGASAQLRNKATTGGNLLQRTRCYYFYDITKPCNKRNPGSGCAAVAGFNRIHAILGTSEHCIATHPSDMAVAMRVLDAVVHIQGANGERSVPLNDFYLLPGSTPNRENVLAPGDLITYVTLPSLANSARSHYLKLPDRASYEFALASAAVVVSLDGNRIQRVRIALGGVGTKPWRSMEAEHALEGREANENNFRAAAEAALKGAKPRHDNAFKVELAKRCLTRTLTNVTQPA